MQQIIKTKKQAIAVFAFLIGAVIIIIAGYVQYRAEQAKRKEMVKESEQADAQAKTRTATEQAAKQQELQAKLEQQQAEFAKTPTGQLCAKHPEWSKNDCERIANKEVWIGMDNDMLAEERGRADSKNVANYGSGDEYQFCWNKLIPRCVYMKDDGIVTSYN